MHAYNICDTNIYSSIILAQRNSLVLSDLHGKELRRCHLIRGAPHDVYPLSIVVLCYIYMGRIYVLSLNVNKTGFHSHESLIGLVT